MIRPTDSIIGPSRGTPEGWFPFVDRSTVTNKAEVKQWIRDTYNVNEPDDMPDAGIVVAQAFVETGNFTNRWWKERKNAGSLGVTGDPVQNEASPTFKTTMASARAMSAHDLLYATGQINRGGLTPDDDPRYSDYREAYGTRAFPKLRDLSGRYAADVMYSTTIAERAEEVYTGTLPDQDEFTSPVDHPPEVVPVINANFMADIIPAGNSNRPGFQLNTDDRIIGITQHTTGNTNVGAGAIMHRNFTHGGGGSDNVSFHFVVDDEWIIQLLPLWEGAYHAADGCDNRATDIGCFDTVAIELCVNSDGNWSKAKDNLAKLYGMLWSKDSRIIGIDRLDVVPDRTTTHQKVSDTRKYCPQQILDEGSLPVIIAQGKQYAALVPDETYAKPIVPAWLATDDGISVEKINNVKVYPVHLTYTVVNETPRKRATGKNHEEVGPPLKPGEVFSAGRAYRSAGVTYVLTDFGTRVTARDLMPKVAITTTGTVSVRYEKAA